MVSRFPPREKAGRSSCYCSINISESQHPILRTPNLNLENFGTFVKSVSNKSIGRLVPWSLGDDFWPPNSKWETKNLRGWGTVPLFHECGPPLLFADWTHGPVVACILEAKVNTANNNGRVWTSHRQAVRICLFWGCHRFALLTNR
jgi:hypothetical protein